MIKTKCLECECDLLVDASREGEGYFLGYDTNFYGDSSTSSSDPHEVVAYYCSRCGKKLRDKAEGIGWKRVD